MPFDPNQPFDVLDEEAPPPFDPSKPWAEVPEEDPWKDVKYTPAGNPSYTDKEGNKVVLSSGGSQVYQTPEGQTVELPPRASAPPLQIVDPFAESAKAVSLGGRFARASLADIGNAGPSNVKAAIQGAELPVDIQLQQLNMPKLATAYKTVGGAIEMAPKMAAVALSGPAAPTVAATLFGFDDQGQFHPAQAAVAAALPLAGKLGGGAAAKLAERLGISSTAAQNVVNAGGRYVTANAVLAAQALPGWSQMNQEQREEAIAGILVNGVLGLADFGGYKTGEGKPDVQKAVDAFQKQAEQSAKLEELAKKSRGIDEQRAKAAEIARQQPGKPVAEPGLPLQAGEAPEFKPATPAIPIKKAPTQRISPAVAAQGEADAQRAQQMATEPSGLSMAVEKAKQAQYGDIPANEQMLGMLPQDRPSLQPPVGAASPAPGPEGQASQTVRMAGEAVQRAQDFPAAAAEKVSQEQEPAVHPDKPLTTNQLRIMQDSIRHAIADNQIPGERKGFIAGSGLEKWADGVLHDSEWLKKANTVGLDMTVEAGKRVAALAVKGTAIMERGVTDFARWSAEMVKQHGNEIKPWLKKVYQQSASLRAGAFSQPEEVSNAAQERQVQGNIQSERGGTEAQRVQGEPSAGGSVQRAAEGGQAPPAGEPPAQVRGRTLTPEDTTDTNLAGNKVRPGNSVVKKDWLAGQPWDTPEAWTGFIEQQRDSGAINQESAEVMGLHLRELNKTDPVAAQKALAAARQADTELAAKMKQLVQSGNFGEASKWSRAKQFAKESAEFATQDRPSFGPSVERGDPPPVGMGAARLGEVGTGAGADKYGVAARVRDERADAGQVAPVEPGKGIAPPDSVEHGRELLASGTDPEQVMSNFEKTKRLSADDMAVARAQGEKLFQRARQIEQDSGTDSPEWRQAFKEGSDWDARSKAMQTEWHATGQAQQGETDLDTGTFTGLQRAFKRQTGKEFTPSQSKEATEIAKTNTKAQDEAAQAGSKLTKHLDDEAAKVKADDPREPVLKQMKVYIGKGMDDFNDVVSKVGTDLGMKDEEVIKLLSKNKQTRDLTDDVWNKQQTARRFNEQARRWLLNQTIPGYLKALQKVPRILFGLKVGFHGTVALGTHAPTVAFQPPFWKTYVQDFGKMYRMVGNAAYHEQQMQSLIRRPNFVTAARAGLINDPFTFEDYNSPETAKYFGNLTGMGNRGYSVLKILRQDMFDQQWGNLPKSQQIPEVAKALADGINHATGVVKGKAPKGSNLALFAPRLEASRVMWLVGDPLKAADTFARWKTADAGQKRFAINQVKEKATVVGTLAGLLALNQGFLSATGSKQKINFTDPMKGDFLKFKAAGMDFSYGNAMLTMARLPVRLYAIREGTGGKLKSLVYPDEDTYTVLGEYGRSQMSPFAALVSDLWLKSDWMKRQLPNSNRPMPARLRKQGIKPYTWPEFWSEQVLPIPAEEAAREVWKNQGMDEKQQHAALKFWATLSVMAATGARVSDDWDEKGKMNW